MAILKTLLLVAQILSALGVIGLVLLQHGKGADVGAAFGSGASGSLFGATGSANFLSRTTAVLATVFFVATLALAYLSNARPVSSGSVLEGAAPITAPAPAASGAAGEVPAPAAGQAPAAGAEGAAQIPTK
jgi:preprotein translocase subunit SecG